MKAQIEKRIIYIAILSLGVLTLFLWFSFKTNQQMIASQNWVNHTNEVIKEVDNIRYHIIEMESSTRGYVISDSSIFILNKIKDENAIRRSLSNFKKLTAEDSEQRKLDARLEKLINRKVELQQQIVELKKRRVAAVQASNSLYGKLLMDSITLMLDKMTDAQNEQLQIRMSEAKKAGEQKMLLLGISTFIYFLFFLSLLKVLNRDATQRKQAEASANESSNQLRVLMNSIQEGFYMLDLNYNIVLTNKDSNTTFSSVQSALLRKPFKSLFAAKDQDTVQQHMEGAVQGNRGRFEISDGQQNDESWLQISYSSISDKHGAVEGIAVLTTDITERKKGEELIKESELKLHSMMSSIKDGFFLLDSSFKISTMNAAARKIVLDLYGKELHIGDEFFRLMPPKRQELSRQVLEKVLKGSTEHLESKFTTPSGERWQESSYFPVYKGNKITGICVTSRDITERMLYQQQLVAAKKAAESAERLQETFLANMSHEIRTPMNGIVGMTDILMNTSLSENQQEYVKTIKQSSDTLLFLINDILDISKIKAGKLSIEKLPFSLDEVLDSILAPFKIKAKEKNIDLRITERPEMPLVLLGDRYRLIQILNNLLGNALKFTQAGHVLLSSKPLILTEENAILEFSIKDSGMGIEEDKIASIFKSFEQGTDSATRRFGGTGLGLAITKNLIELQGGEIGVTSFPGHGTTFTFILNFPIINSVDAIKTTNEVIVDTNSFKGKRILVAEDNEVNQKVISYNLLNCNIQVTIAENGREAIEFLEMGNQYDLIIMDLQMPEMNGFQAATYIRNKLKLNVPIIAMTASVMRNERVKCLAVGMNDYISKPFSNSELFLMMAKLMGVEEGLGQSGAIQTLLTNELYDLSYLEEMDDANYTAEILSIFLQTVPTQLQRIKNGILHNKVEEISSAAHRLKTSFVLLKMHRLLNLSTEIENISKGSEHLPEQQISDIASAFRALEEQFLLVKPLIWAELKQLRIDAV